MTAYPGKLRVEPDVKYKEHDEWVLPCKYLIDRYSDMQAELDSHSNMTDTVGKIVKSLAFIQCVTLSEFLQLPADILDDSQTYVAAARIVFENFTSNFLAIDRLSRIIRDVKTSKTSVQRKVTRIALLPLVLFKTLRDLVVKIFGYMLIVSLVPLFW